MNFEDLTYYYNKFKFGDENFHRLMNKRVSNILLISSVYDSYVLEKDGLLSEQIYGEFRQLDLSISPRIKHITFSDDYMAVLNTNKYDHIILMMRVGKVSPKKISNEIKSAHPEIPLQLLITKELYFTIIKNNENDLNNFDDVFLWTGDAKLFIAMIKCVEDRMNVEHDVKIGHVRIVLMIERSIEYYSLYLPLYYSEVMKLTQELIEFELHDEDKRLRMRARPKILLVHDYENAMELYNKYRNNIICIVTNVYFKCNNALDDRAGVKLVRKIRESNPDIPILMQSADPENELEAKKLNTEFHNKDSKTLLADVRHFFITNLGFGDFTFRNEDGDEIDRAKSMYHFEKKILTIPEESLFYHANRNHFSAWLMAHGEVEIAKQIRYIVTADFLSVDDIRKFLTNTINKVRKERNKGKLVKFDVSIFTEEEKIVQLAEGSLGGKGRGLAFLNAFLTSMELNKEFDEIDIKIPKTAIIGTNEFDDFLDNNDITIDSVFNKTDRQINDIFLKGEISNDLIFKLKRLILNCNSPLAIRSSGLLEDSQSQPFAGVYDTYMLPNNEEDIDDRLEKLLCAVKLIFASPFRVDARKYLNSIQYQAEEEKMAVVIQEVAGTVNENELFFPNISGTAQSYNFYPIKGMKHEDGIAVLAVGLGKAIVDGGLTLRFCPNYPRIDLQKPEEIVQNSQRSFFAIDLKRDDYNLREGEEATLRKKMITQKNIKDIFHNLSSVWDYENLSFIDNAYSNGPRVITFRNQIHYNQLPISRILKRILEIGKIGLGVPVEIEYALVLGEGQKPCFYLLQIRPLSINSEELDLDLDNIAPKEIFLLSTAGIGNGRINGIQDIVFIDPDKFDNTQTVNMSREIEEINLSLKAKNRPYILIGPGRWGTSDRFLGIPVRWAHIDMAKVIVETIMDNFFVEASQGSHFFHNLVAMNIGYLTLQKDSKKDFIDWDWLEKGNIVSKKKYAVHVELNDPVKVKIDGHSGISVILKN